MYKHILVPVVFDEDHDTQASFEIARTLADDGAKFTVIHVLEAVPAYFTAEIPSKLLEKSHDDAAKSLAQRAKSLPGASPVLISGHAGRTLVEYAEEHDVDCIVIASHRPGFGDLFLGSTAARVVRHAKCSVHVIR
ncbi:universal stress protein [Litoreibacter arenae]|uniref:universal stress protein n=1 Tax=Litoreibacter arenae TaxID=491388 RepID=UPI000593036B|nr:universal stress protein [Litoreibacter arenae]